MPALHRRNLPNYRPLADGGMRKCNAVEDYARRGACPPLGPGRGVALSALPIRRTKPQLQLFIPSCAGASRPERLVRKCPYAASIVPRNPTNLPDRHSGEGRNPGGWGEGNVVRGLVPRWGGGGAWQNPTRPRAASSQNSSFSYLGVPATTGMSDWHESMSRTPIRDDVTRFRKCFGVPEIFRIVIPAKSRPRTPIRGRNPGGWEAPVVATGILPTTRLTLGAIRESPWMGVIDGPAPRLPIDYQITAAWHQRHYGPEHGGGRALERETGLEPATTCLEGRNSTS